MTEITVTIKCSNADKATIVIEKSALVSDLKDKIAETLSVPSALQRLIYKGRVLKDESTLDFYDIQDGHTVHMVKGSAPGASSTTTSTTTPTPVAAPNSMGSLGMPAAANPANMFGGLGGMMGNQFGGMPDISTMQEQLMRNPEMMQQIMSSPMMDNLLNNPDMLRNMMGNNPQMQAMLDSNPQIRHIMNDPAVSYCLF